MTIAASIVASLFNAGIVARVKRRLPQFERAAIPSIAVPVATTAIVVSIPITIPVAITVAIAIVVPVAFTITITVVAIVVIVLILGIVTVFKRYLEISTIEVSAAEPRVVILGRIAISAKVAVIAIAVARAIVSPFLRSFIEACVQRCLPQIERATPIRIAIPVSALGGGGSGDGCYQKGNRTDSIPKMLCDHASSSFSVTDCHAERYAQQFEYRATRRKRRPPCADRYRH